MWNVNRYIYIYIHTYIYVYVNICVYIYTCVYIYLYINTIAAKCSVFNDLNTPHIWTNLYLLVCPFGSSVGSYVSYIYVIWFICAGYIYVITYMWSHIYVTTFVYVITNIYVTYERMYINWCVPLGLQLVRMSQTYMWYGFICAGYIHVIIYMSSYIHVTTFVHVITYGVATISRLHKVTGLFCKRALWKRLYSEKETHNFKAPTNRSHPISMCDIRTNKKIHIHMCTSDKTQTPALFAMTSMSHTYEPMYICEMRANTYTYIYTYT